MAHKHVPAKTEKYSKHRPRFLPSGPEEDKREALFFTAVVAQSTNSYANSIKLKAPVQPDLSLAQAFFIGQITEAPPERADT